MLDEQRQTQKQSVNKLYKYKKNVETSNTKDFYYISENCDEHLY